MNITPEQIREKLDAIKCELGKVLVGQKDVVEQILVTIIAGGHAMLTGVPGLGKTMLVKSIAQLLSLSFKRIQFTPDLMPADIFGTEVLDVNQEDGKRSFSASGGNAGGRSFLFRRRIASLPSMSLMISSSSSVSSLEPSKRARIREASSA